ncbi:MAG TPA: hypothetical protein K8W20_22365 [Pseudomonas lactis]|uniref:Uncharacterized protein n=1 Tax=Pseudomonas lactis TaxID=1615674 RepID=A0A921T9X3_9PSED|nr:hypothetical protein [Pseudomonas lactis]HJH21434.1 hypothetical protein [Pseudomonas lactis]
MPEVHRYQVVTMLSMAGATIGYDPHGPDVVMASDFDNATRLFLDAAERCIASERREKELQQRLTAADERADVLEVIVGEVLDAVGREPLNLDAVLRLRSRMRAALKPAECAADEHVCTGCGAKGWTANCKECVPY